MIPASYLFKPLYRQHWEEPAPIEADAPPLFPTGLLTGLLDTITQWLGHPVRTRTRYGNTHAYD